MEDEARRVEKERDEERERQRQEVLRKRDTLRMIEEENRRELESESLRKSRLNDAGAPVVLGIGPGFRAVSSLPPGHAGLAKDNESGEEPKTATSNAAGPSAGEPLGIAPASVDVAGLSELDVLDMRGLELIDTDDEKDEELAYQQWKLRELKRVKRDREDRNKEKCVILLFNVILLLALFYNY